MILYHIVRSDGLSIVSLGTTYSLEAAKETIRKNIHHYNNRLKEQDDSNFFKMYSMSGMEYAQIDDEEDESCCWRVIPIKVDMCGEAV